jgi:phosphoribosylamine--glycine ligase
LKILVVGGGGREHALCWKLSRSRDVRKVYCAPGNAGTALVAENVPIAATDIEGLRNFAELHSIDLTVVGPEKPLVLGIVDAFEARGLRIFGPSAEPARLEGSKVFSKELMAAAGIPTAPFRVFDNPEAALGYLRERSFPCVVKADGDAAGKGVVVAKTFDEAAAAVGAMMVERVFGPSGERVVVEDCLVGEEASVMAFVDGRTVAVMVPIQDHKRIGEGDTGPNTGGMGAYAPVPNLSSGQLERIVETILQPAVDAIRETGIPYRGVLFAGIMLTPDGPMCLEFNCRFGDPETQVALPLLETDLCDILRAVVDVRLEEQPVVFADRAAVTVVMAAGGYPGTYRTGDPIEGIESASSLDAVEVFQAGTTVDDDGTVRTAGGRVLTVTATGADFTEARMRAYEGVGRIQFDGAVHRRDIGWRAMGTVS